MERSGGIEIGSWREARERGRGGRERGEDEVAEGSEAGSLGREDRVEERTTKGARERMKGAERTGRRE